ncbi:MAG: hypothetical protein FJW96_16950 [Actinobacteria bacterium]|nr:hypothetical protein [Actinomycetota bacterium]
MLAAGERLERDVLAACLRHPSLRDGLAAMSPEHFENADHRRVREAIVRGREIDDDLVALHAALDALADRNAIDQRTGQELLYRLRERKLRRDLVDAASDLVRTTELQAQLAKVRQALGELA